MGRSRAIFFECDNEDHDIHFDFGTFALCMYYAVQLNVDKAKKLFDATISEWKYRVEYELPIGNLISENYEAHFIPSEIEETITFLENDLIPALNNEIPNLLIQYGGISNFLDLYYNSAPFLGFNGVFENEVFDGDGKSLAHYMNLLKIILQYSLSVNKPCDVHVR